MGASVTMQVGQSVPVSLVETRADGSTYTPNKGDVALTIDNTTAGDLTDNGDGTGSLKATAPGIVTVTGTDKVTGLSATGTATITAVVPPPPTSAAINFGTPA